MQAVMEQASFLADLKNPLKAIGGLLERKECAVNREGAAAEREGRTAEQIISRLETLAESRRKQMESLRRANSLSETDRKKSASVLRFLEESRRELRMEGGLSMEDIRSGEAAYKLLKKKYNDKVSELRREADNVQTRLHALFSFVEEAFGRGNEMLILVTELTRNSASSRFIAAFGCPDYARHSEGLMLAERRADILAQIAGIEGLDADGQ